MPDGTGGHKETESTLILPQFLLDIRIFPLWWIWPPNLVTWTSKKLYLVPQLTQEACAAMNLISCSSKTQNSVALSTAIRDRR